MAYDYKYPELLKNAKRLGDMPPEVAAVLDEAIASVPPPVPELPLAPIQIKPGLASKETDEMQSDLRDRFLRMAQQRKANPGAEQVSLAQCFANAPDMKFAVCAVVAEAMSAQRGHWDKHAGWQMEPDYRTRMEACLFYRDITEGRPAETKVVLTQDIAGAQRGSELAKGSKLARRALKIQADSLNRQVEQWDREDQEQESRAAVLDAKLVQSEPPGQTVEKVVDGAAE